MGHNENTPMREVPSGECQCQKNRMIPNNLMLYIKVLEKQEQSKLRACTRKEVTKIRAETNEMET